MKKVMHLMSTHEFSGAENVACQIINAFKDDNNYKMIYVSEIKKNEKKLKEKNINYYKLDNFNIKCLKKAINDIKPDIIHAHDIKASILASFFHKKAKIISHVHSNHENMRKINAKTLIYKVFSKWYSKIIWVSQSAIDNFIFKKSIIKKSVVLYNVIDGEEVRKKIKEDNNQYIHYDLIYLGRLTYAKNPIRLIEIISKLKSNCEKIKVAIVGDGELKTEMEKKIEKLNLQGNIDMFGFVSNPYKILDSADLMVMTSIYEGTPMCALEAMSLGKPIVGTPTDGLNDLVEKDINGFLIDDDKEIVEYIINLKNDIKKLNKMKMLTLKKFKEINDICKYKKEIRNIYE